MNFFFDSYAIVEILKANPAYSRFQEEAVLTSGANLGEVYYCVLRMGEEKEYREKMSKLTVHLINPEVVDWENASALRFLQKGKRLSLIDCLGYELAKKHGLSFLTGEKEFEKMPNVTHVK